MSTVSFPKALLDIDRTLVNLQRVRRAKSGPRFNLRQERLNLVDNLKGHRFCVAGEGEFAVTLVRGNWAAKIVLTRESKGALAYLRCSRSQNSTNRLLPKVVRIRRVGRYSVIFMERLCGSRKGLTPVKSRVSTALFLRAAIKKKWGISTRSVAQIFVS